MSLLLRIETHGSANRLPGTAIEFCGPVVITVGPDPEQPLAARLAGTASAREIETARARMVALGVPERFEWIEELRPSQGTAFQDLVVRRHPLLVLGSLCPRPDRPRITIERVGADSPDDLAAAASAVAAIAFSYTDEQARPADGTEVELATALLSRPAELARTRAGLREEGTSLWLARLDGAAAASARTIPDEGVAEIVGVGTVAAYRGKGLATAVTWHAANAALADGADMVFLSAEDETSAKLYARLGFNRVGTLCVAEPPTS